MQTDRYKTWILHIEQGDKAKLLVLINESNLQAGVKTKYTFEKLAKVLRTGEEKPRIIEIISTYFSDKVKKKELSNK